MAPKFASIEYYAPLFNIVFALPDLVGDIARGDGLHLVGPPSGEARNEEISFPWDKLDAARPLVVVSCGSVLRWRPGLFDALGEATAPLGVQCVFAAGEVAEKRSFPDHVIAVPFMPQLALLRRASAMVTVGGANTMNESLCAAVPMLILPSVSDQPLQAHVIERAGAGLSIDMGSLTADNARTALSRLLDPTQGFRERIQHIQRAYLAADSPAAVATLVDEACR
jgi:MGT family glycosyltransferase